MNDINNNTSGVMSPRIEVNRLPLSKQVPLDTPFSVTLVPSTYCNFACSFCPVKEISDKPSLMSIETAKNIIDNANFPQQVKVLHLYNVGEPLINKDFIKIIKYARQTNFAHRISTVTNASLLTKNLSEELIASGVDRIIISLYGLNDDDYLKTTKKKIKFETIYENIKYLNSIKGDCEIFVKVIDRVTPTEQTRQEFINKFKEISTFYSIETILPIWPNFRPEKDDPSQREDFQRGLYEGVPAIDRVACHYPFYSMVVNPKGIVNPCLADWDGLLKLGDTNNSSLNEIWNAKEYQDFRYEQLSGQRKEHPLCRTCGTLKAATAPDDDMDEDRLYLLDKLFGDRIKQSA
ncbi:MAG: radical SAM protein [Gammaproteobacteria bacterium]|nr:radical SAM protein [Gammaproteobacteria bacterium]